MSNGFNSQSQASSKATFSFSSSASFSSSTSSSGTGANPQRREQIYSQRMYADPSGATVTTSSSRDGGQPTVETRRYDAPGRQLEAEGGRSGQRRIEDVTDEPDDEESYEEKMEGEYAKREGGA